MDAGLGPGPADESEGFANRSEGWVAGLAQGQSIKVRDWRGPGRAGLGLSIKVRAGGHRDG